MLVRDLDCRASGLKALDSDFGLLDSKLQGIVWSSWC